MKKLIIPALVICTSLTVASPVLALDKSSPKCLPFVASDPDNGIMFETYMPVSSTAGGTPEGIWTESNELGVSTTASSNPDGLTAEECTALGYEIVSFEFAREAGLEEMHLTRAELKARERMRERLRERRLRRRGQ